PAAHPEDVAGVAAGHAVVDDVRVQAGQVERGQRRCELQHDDDRDRPPIWPDVGADETEEHGATSRYTSRCGLFRIEFLAHGVAEWPAGVDSALAGEDVPAALGVVDGPGGGGHGSFRIGG